jgi:hypothetical protein
MLLQINRRYESWTVIQARMLRETERFLEEALRSPEGQFQIPTIKVGEGGFTRVFAQLFWAQALGSS